MAIVNAANAELKPGGGVAGAIHRKAGPKLYEECKKVAPIRPGEAVLTKGYNLPNPYVIHCLGPVYGVDKPEDQILSRCYENALKIAEENRITSIAFPAISTGAFGYPMEPATRIALKTVLQKIPHLQTVEEIRFILYSRKDGEIYLRIWEEVFRS